LRDRAFALTIERHSQAILFATNAIAEQVGLKPGMRLADARAIFPGLKTEAKQTKEDEAILEKIRNWCSRYSPWTSIGEEKDDWGKGTAEQDQALEGPGGAGIWLDATGCTHLFGGEEAMLADLTKKTNQLGFSSRAAMAETKGAAWALARYHPNDKGNWTTAPLGEVRQHLIPLPVSALRLSSNTILKLHSVGLRTIGDLLLLPRSTLAVRYGETLLERLDSAIGNISEPISTQKYKEPLYVRLTFSEPIGRREDIKATLEKLLLLLCKRMEDRGIGTRRSVFTLYRTDGSIERRLAKTAQPVCDNVILQQLFSELIDDIDAGFGIEEATLFADRTEALSPHQTKLIGHNSNRDFSTLIDQLVNRFGPENVLRPRLAESHIPERAGILSPIVGPPLNIHIQKKVANRPIRLLRPPEEIEAVTIVSKFSFEPPPIFRWRRQLHKVVMSEGPERIAPEWWQEENTGTRDYFQVEDKKGQRFWLFRETDDEQTIQRWYVQGLFS
jgi:protein ImuB